MKTIVKLLQHKNGKFLRYKDYIWIQTDNLYDAWQTELDSFPNLIFLRDYKIIKYEKTIENSPDYSGFSINYRRINEE